MTWASIVAAPPPPTKTSKVGLKFKTKSEIPSPSVPDVDKATFEVRNLSLDDVIEPEGFVDISVSTRIEEFTPSDGAEQPKTEVETDDSGYIKNFTQVNDHEDTENENFEGCATSSKAKKTESQALEAQALNEYLNPKGDKTIQWCIDHKDEILDLHSSVAWTKVFPKECDGCGRFFKHCMFSNSERKARHGYTSCRWCNLDKEVCNEAESFTIHHHLHCNRPGKKECGTNWGLNLVRPKKKVENLMVGNGLGDVEGPKVVMRVDGGMSQKEKKKKGRKEREMVGL